MIFETASPESTGIPSYAVKNFLTRLEKQQLPLHSAIIMRHGKYVLKLIMHHIIKILFTACFQLPKVLFLWQ